MNVRKNRARLLTGRVRGLDIGASEGGLISLGVNVMTREISMVPHFNETTSAASKPAGGPTRDTVAGVLLVTVYFALWACVSATVLAPLSAMFG